MELHRGECQCGHVKIELTLSMPLDQYTPRQCDCDFCTGYDTAYLSDPKGLIDIHAGSTLIRKQQGSDQAEFLVCNDCDTLIAAVYSKEHSLIGALNYSTLDSKDLFNSPQSASPKLLAAGEKLERWKKLWMDINLLEQEER